MQFTAVQKTRLYIAIGVVVLLVIVIVVAVKGSSSSSSSSSNPNPNPNPNPSSGPIAPFKTWTTGGNQYYLDISKQGNWNGMVSNDTTPIQCTGSLSSTQCETDLATAGHICDNTSGCIGIIYNIADPTHPTAIPVNTTPALLYETTVAANGGGAVFLASDIPSDGYFSFSGVPNTTWAKNEITSGIVTGVGPITASTVVYCATLDIANAGTCGGVLIPDYTSSYQQTNVQSHFPPMVGLDGVVYDALNTSATPNTSFTSAIALKYNAGSG